MTTNFYYGKEAMSFQFVKYPLFLHKNEYFRDNLSDTSKIIYGLLLDRMSLSIKHEWLDSEGRVYIKYAASSLANMLGKSKPTVLKCLSELEKADLIVRVKIGKGKPDIIYVKNFLSQEDGNNSSKDYPPEDEEEKKVYSLKQRLSDAIDEIEGEKLASVEVSDEPFDKNSQTNSKTGKKSLPHCSRKLSTSVDKSKSGKDSLPPREDVEISTKKESGKKVLPLRLRNPKSEWSKVFTGSGKKSLPVVVKSFYPIQTNNTDERDPSSFPLPPSQEKKTDFEETCQTGRRGGLSEHSSSMRSFGKNRDTGEDGVDVSDEGTSIIQPKGGERYLYEKDYAREMNGDLPYKEQSERNTIENQFAGSGEKTFSSCRTREDSSSFSMGNKEDKEESFSLCVGESVNKLNDNKNKRGSLKEMFLENIDYELISSDLDEYNFGVYENVVKIATGIMDSEEQRLRINGKWLSAEKVKTRLLELDQFHIDYVCEVLLDNDTKIRNIKAYVATLLYNAPETMDTYIQNKVNMLLS